MKTQGAPPIRLLLGAQQRESLPSVSSPWSIEDPVLAIVDAVLALLEQDDDPIFSISTTTTTQQ
jgi:hypothetical protein